MLRQAEDEGAGKVSDALICIERVGDQYETFCGYPAATADDLLRHQQRQHPDGARFNPRRGRLSSMQSPREGERCLVCNALEPSSHSPVRLGDNLHWGVVCASHTIRELVFSRTVWPTLEPGELEEPSGWLEPRQELYLAGVAWYRDPSADNIERLRKAIERAWEYPLPEDDTAPPNV